MNDESFSEYVLGQLDEVKSAWRPKFAWVADGELWLTFKGKREYRQASNFHGTLFKFVQDVTGITFDSLTVVHDPNGEFANECQMQTEAVRDDKR